MIVRNVMASLSESPITWWFGAVVAFRTLPLNALGAALIEWPRRREANSETSKEAAR